MNTIDQIDYHARKLDDPRLWELATYALRLQAGRPVPRPEYDDDPVLQLLKRVIALSPDDKRRFNALLARIVQNEGRRLTLVPSPAGDHEYVNARRPGDWRQRRTAVLRRIRRTP